MTHNEFEIEWPHGYFDRREAETPDKGWLEVAVRLPGGERFQFCFYGLARAAQALDDARARGEVSFFEPGLVLVDEVNTTTVQRAVAERWRAGFFTPPKGRP